MLLLQVVLIIVIHTFSWHSKVSQGKITKNPNKAARLITGKGEDDSKTILKELHWLPIKARIDFKIACHVYKCLHGLAPPPPPPPLPFRIN